MKTILNTSRRKKIKTRKSLNEIRKRSKGLINPEAKPTKTAGEMGYNQKRNHFITANRLTLAMFPNSVTSETVTRLGNDEVKKNLNLILNLKKIIQDRDDLSINKELVEQRQSSDSENSIQNISDDDRQESDVNIDRSESQVVVSRENNPEHATLHGTHVLSPLTDSSLEAHYTHEKYYLYEEFMSEISVYLKQTIAKSLLTEDFIDKLKRNLVTLKIQSDLNAIPLKQKSTMHNINISNTSHDMVDDPMDYIRLRYSALQNTPTIQSQHSTGSSDSVDSLLHIPSSQPALSSSGRTDLSDTPEYIYYPHKIN